MLSVRRPFTLFDSQLLTTVPAIVEDARLPNRYRMLISTVDVIFADVAQPDQARIVILNAESFLKDLGHVVISIKASCIDSTAPADVIFAAELQKLKEGKFKALEQVTLEPYERDHAMVSGAFFLGQGLASRLTLLQRNTDGISLRDLFFAVVFLSVSLYYEYTRYHIYISNFLKSFEFREVNDDK